MRMLAIRWTALALLALGVLGAPARGDEPVADPYTAALPHDPDLVHGELANGLRYVLDRHGNPEGRISLWLHISTGSLNETEAQRGIAHYLEHMAFNGSKNFPPGSVVSFFESMGMSFGRDQNAFTSFDQTVYMLALPNCEADTIEKGLLYLSDVGLRLSLLPKEIDDERGVILEEKRTRAGAQQRVQEYVMERLAPESLFGLRIPIGTEATIQSVQESDFRAYYGKWYVPSNMTLIAVGDCDMGPVAKAIEKAFADGTKVARPADQDVGVKPQETTRAIVATDPELTSAEISIVRVDRPRAPRATVGDFRRELVEGVATWIFNRRVSKALAEGKVSYVEARASLSEMAGAIRSASVEASGKPGDWRAVLRDMALILQQARRYGFTAREVEDARTELLADAEQAVRRSETAPARMRLFRLLRPVNAGEPILSAEQNLELTKTLLPGVTPAEVSAVFRQEFDPTHATFIAALPTGDGVPTEEQLIELGRAALAVEPPKPAEETRAETLMSEAPKAGKVAEAGTHEATGVWSAWYENGLRVHHKKNDQRKGEVSVQITLAGGEIEETKENRGITEAAALAWSRPATRKLTSTQIRDLMTGKNVRVRGGAAHDTLTLSVSGDVADVETGLQLAHLLLTDPLLEPAALAQWKEQQAQAIRGRALQPVGVLSEAVAKTFYPAVASMQPLTIENVEKISVEAAQAWLARLVKEAPIEVAVVGDLELAQAQELVSTYLGSLPQRAKIAPDLFASLRKIPRPQGPLAVRERVPTQTPQAFVLDGFFAADLTDVPEQRRLQIASQILTTRMIATIREEKQLVYGIGAGSRPSEAYPGFGLFLAQAPTDPARIDALAEAIEAAYQSFKEKGPTTEELTVAKKQVANQLDEGMKTARFWMQRLQELDYRGLKLEYIVEMSAAYQAITAEEVKQVFARYCVPEGRFRFEVLPE